MENLKDLGLGKEGHSSQAGEFRLLYFKDQTQSLDKADSFFNFLVNFYEFQNCPVFGHM